MQDNKEVKIEEKIWDAVCLYLAHYAGVDDKEIVPNTNVFELFNGDADKFEKALMNIIYHFQKHEEKHYLKLDIPKSEQFDGFKTVENVFLYFVVRINKMENEAKDFLRKFINNDE